MAPIKRYLPTNVEFRGEGDNPEQRGFGHFAVFNQETELWPGFREKIDPEAFSDVMDNDVAVMTNHEANNIIARTSAGTARIGTDSTGAWVEWDFPDTTAGRDTRENMRIKNITGMSFGFTVKEDRLDRDAEGNITRTIMKLERLYDASPVAFPAYQQTDAQLREELRSEMEARPDWPGAENSHDDEAFRIQQQHINNRLKILSH